ncbi:MAG TPA: exosortase A [Alphaproteobacteria bacterium]|nr:exosortase A [Alphaproteobacteria bacterium]
MMHPSADTAPTAPSDVASRSWRLAYIAAAAGLVLIPAIFAEATASMVSTWMVSSTFNHGPMIPALAAYLAWRRRDTLAGVPPRFEWLGLAALTAAVLIWLVGRLSATMVVQQFGLVFSLQAFVLCVLGRHIVWRLLFPLFYLIFAVPFGAELVPPLQDITAFFVVSLLRLVGIPVFIDGVFIATPAGNYLVAEACAGLRYLISMIALGLVFANLTFDSWHRRALFIGLSIVVPIIANGIRAFLIVLIAYVSDNEIATGIDHVIYGWVFFSFVTFLLFALGYAMREPLAEENPRTPAIAPASHGSGNAPVIAACASVAIVLAASLYAESALGRSAALSTSIAPPELSGFAKVAPPPGAWQPVFIGADRQIDQVYERGGRRIGLHVGLYSHERQGAKAVTGEHDFEPTALWKSGAPGTIELALPDGRLSAVTLRVSAPGRYRTVWYWYWIGGAFTGSPYDAKLLSIRTLLSAGNPATAVVAVSAEYPVAQGEPTDLLREMVAAAPAIRTMLENAVRGTPGAARIQ